MKLMTYNINKGKGWNFLQNNFKALQDLIIKYEADIVLLQEVVGINYKRDIMKDQFEELADLIWRDYRYAKNSSYSQGHHGNVILSKFPITEFYQRDISTNTLEQRGILYSKIRINTNIDVHVYNLHLDLTQSGRSKQLNQVVKIKDKSHNSKDRIVIAGDFNDWLYTVNKKLKCVGFCEVGEVSSGKSYKTFPSLLPFLRLDRIYFRNLSLVTSKAINGIHKSDHLPLISEFEII